MRRTARLALRGPEPAAARELWYAVHGYGELAAKLLEGMRAVDDGSRLLVAPEALSKFYVGELSPAHRDRPVGASWMTRDDRDAEIADYVAYLDDVHDAIAKRFGRTPPVTVLGFSQGGATALRWVAAGRVRPARVVIWAASLPPELDYTATDSPLRAPEFVYVAGTRDEFITKKVLDQQLALLTRAAFPFRMAAFEGGHRLDDATLTEIAASAPRQ